MARKGTRAIIAVLFTIMAAGGAGAETTTDYAPPFLPGPGGGDAFNYRSADPGGRVTVGRAYPIPAVVSCGAGAAHAKLLVEHTVSDPITSVQVSYTDAAVDPYVFLSVRVHAKDGLTYGGRKVRGVLAGDGVFEVPVEWPTGEDAPTDAVVEFGLEVSSACPSLNAGTIRFTSVSVTS
jgi:hypothetical protein